MTNVVEFVTFKLKEGVTEEQLLAASDTMNSNFLSLQKGYIERKLVKREDTWGDIVLWETMEDALGAMSAVEDVYKEGSADLTYFEYIEQSTCELNHLTVEKNY